MTADDSDSAALVLGSGGVLGSSFHAGVLLALHEVWGLDCRRIDELLGTSAGALTGAFIAAGLSPADLVRREQGRTPSPAGQRILSRRPARSDRRPDPEVSSPGFPASPTVAWSALRRPGSVMPGAVLAGLMPRGRTSTEALEATVDGLLGGQWPTRQVFRVAAVKLATGARHVFGSDDHVRPGEAVAAACAVPAIHRPVTIGADEYFDGAVHSANNLDAVGDRRLIIVSSPSTSGDWLNSTHPLMLGRLGAGLQLRSEARRVQERARVVIIEPDATVLAAMGTDVMRTTNRAAVAIAAHQMATRHLRKLDKPSTKVGR